MDQFIYIRQAFGLKSPDITHPNIMSVTPIKTPLHEPYTQKDPLTCIDAQCTPVKTTYVAWTGRGHNSMLDIMKL